METSSPRRIQFTMPLLDSQLDPEAAEQIRRRRPTPATLVASSDQSSPEVDEDRLPNQLYKAALMNSPLQRRKGARSTPTMKELQFLVEHHLYRQQQAALGGDECSSESCLLCCQLEEFSRESQSLDTDGTMAPPLLLPPTDPAPVGTVTEAPQEPEAAGVEHAMPPERKRTVSQDEDE
ncbi:hypothetical protein AAFF_G00298290 [Aldrovandia affinis]|uniref:Protein phosphatase 1 regulatory subunit 1A n=1 Tax=Aldrovandia affinis TaxID=143900 RepID=A0AAD7W0I3_9TELE|nr:hypothetical protein AAFF_G00298290 [Aldrovandia affinis]